MSLLVALMLGFADPAAATVRGKVTPPARADDEALPSPFRLDQAPFEFERVPLAGGNGLELANVRFPSPLTTPHPENNTVYGELFRPRGVKRPPCAIVLHIAGGDFPLARFVASMLAHRGTAALFVKLPYYGERRPPGGKIRMLSADMERSLTSMRQAVLDLRRCCDWIAAQPDLDGDRIGVIGISLGAIVGGLASAIEPRLSHACLVMGGAQLQHVMYESSERDADRMKQAWEAVGGTRELMAFFIRPFDASTYGDRLKNRIVLLISAAHDEVIPRKCNDALWEATGRQRNEFYECGHYTMVGYLIPALGKATQFFADWPKERLPPAAPPPPPAPKPWRKR